MVDLRERKTTLVLVGLGSNLNHPEAHIRDALSHLKKLPDSTAFQASSLHHTRPMGSIQQPDYVNAVACLQTTLPVRQVWKHLLAIETKMGRVRDQRWGPRLIDLDLLAYGQERFVFPELTVPHVGLMHRPFVLAPLAELMPHWRLPNGQTAQERWAHMQAVSATMR